MQFFVAVAAAANYCSWRQTAGCDPDGVREPHGDAMAVSSGSSAMRRSDLADVRRA